MRVSLGDLTGFLADAPVDLADDGCPADPLVLVDLEDGAPDKRTVEAIRENVSRVLVGVAGDSAPTRWPAIVRSLDCTLISAAEPNDGRAVVQVTDLDAEVAAIRHSVTRSPRAALALCRLLRVTEMLPVQHGLIAESAVYSMLLAGSEFHRWRSTHEAREKPRLATPPVLMHRSGDDLDILLNCPERRNAVGREMRDALVEAFDLVLADDSICSVSLRGAGPAFSSGGDLDEFGTTTDVSTAHLIRLQHSVASRIHRCRDRVSVTVHGACIGAGIEIPSFASWIIARPDAWFQLPEIGMGLVPGAGGTVGITKRIGRWRAAYMMLGGNAITPSRAVSWGLVDQVLALE